MLISRRSTNILLVLILAVGIGIVAMLASGVRGGPLDPPGPPASTMHTLDDAPVVWDRMLAADDGAPGPNPPAGCDSTRFHCVLGTAAVLDRETGLVWQRTPPSGTESWAVAVPDCMAVSLGGRYGWRLPRIEEFNSLLDSSGLLPTSNPFTNLNLVGYYWTSSTDPSISNQAFVNNFGSAPSASKLDKTTLNHVWCVRGGSGLDGM